MARWWSPSSASQLAGSRSSRRWATRPRSSSPWPCCVAITLLPRCSGSPATACSPGRPRRRGRRATRTRPVGALGPLGRPPPLAQRAIAATAVLVTLAIPVLDMRLGQADAGTDPTSTTHRRAYDLLAAGFRRRVQRTVAGRGRPRRGARRRRARSDRRCDVERSRRRAVSPPELNAAGDTGLVTVHPDQQATGPGHQRSVHRLRDSILPAPTAHRRPRWSAGRPQGSSTSPTRSPTGSRGSSPSWCRCRSCC